MYRHPPRSSLFPDTTLFRSSSTKDQKGGTSEMKRPRLLAFALPLAGIVILLLSLLVGGASGGSSNHRYQWLDEPPERSEEHTSELQSQSNTVCRLLLVQQNY